MPRNTSPWPTDHRSRGCGWSTRPPGPSWGRRFSPRAFWSQVEPRATQTALRSLFSLWGLPRGLRVDNGMPWGSQGDLPTDLVCWLAGLGPTVTANPPRRPEDNGVVERSQGVGQAWGEPWVCRSTGELQRRMDELDRWQRELYPAIAGMPRMQAYPGLKHSGRSYDPAREDRVWDRRAAWDLMASHLVPRDVSSQGKVSLYNRPYSVGLRWAGRKVWVGFDAELGAWTFQDEGGHEIRRQVAPELSADRIQMLEVTNRRRGAHAAKPRAPTTPAKPTSS